MSLSVAGWALGLAVSMAFTPARARKGHSAEAFRRILGISKHWRYRGPAGRVFPLPVDIRLELTGRVSGKVARVDIFATLANAGKSCRITLKAVLDRGRYHRAKTGPALTGRVALDTLDTSCRSKAIQALVAKLRKELKRDPPTVTLLLRGRALCPDDGPSGICLTRPPPKARRKP